MSVESIDGIVNARYFIIFVDDCFKTIFGYCLNLKTEVLTRFSEFKAFIEKQTG